MDWPFPSDSLTEDATTHSNSPVKKQDIQVPSSLMENLISSFAPPPGEPTSWSLKGTDSSNKNLFKRTGHSRFFMDYDAAAGATPEERDDQEKGLKSQRNLKDNDQDGCVSQGETKTGFLHAQSLSVSDSLFESDSDIVENIFSSFSPTCSSPSSECSSGVSSGDSCSPSETTSLSFEVCLYVRSLVWNRTNFCSILEKLFTQL
jgi:hypothetical protein